MKTAVEWLIEQINPYGVSVHQDLFEQAKEMEKEQKEKTYTKAFDAGYDNAKEYYNKTFKQQEQ
jgi:hypothetical protein